MEASLKSLLNAASEDRLIIFAGAGISSAPPSRLPGWNDLQHQIASALAARLEPMGWPNWLVEDVETLRRIREAQTFPPEYQAQLIHEMSGDRYFRGLQSLDVTVTNRSHQAIAKLLSAKKVRAVITTNFDRLIERSLDAISVKYCTYIDAAGFSKLSSSRASGRSSRTIIKIHGCVGRHLSMIDTLKQRLVGRKDALEAAIASFRDCHWLFVGFSAYDLVSNPDYLGLRKVAHEAAGGTYLAWPGIPPSPIPRLGPGAQLLIEAFPGRANVIVEDASTFLSGLCEELGLAFTEAPNASQDGRSEFNSNLTAWAATLSNSAAGLSLAAIFEGAGMGERTARVLHDLVYSAISPPSLEDPDWLDIQMHYGRVGAVNGRFTNVPNMDGVESNASVESLQSVFRAAMGSKSFKYQICMPGAFLWKGMSKHARSHAEVNLYRVLRYIRKIGELETVKSERKRGNTKRSDGIDPILPVSSDEEAIDAWLVAAQVLVLLKKTDVVQLAIALREPILRRAVKCGDPVRAARVIGLSALLAAEFSEDPSDKISGHEPILAEAKRVGDGFHSAMINLALGRWRVGWAGIDEVRRGKITATESAARAEAFLYDASESFKKLACRGWSTYAHIQGLKALADVRRFDEVNRQLDTLQMEVRRLPVLMPDYLVTLGQLHYMTKDFAAARDCYNEAIRELRDMDFPRENIETVKGYLDDPYLR
ncbi:SIR2 family protein [Rhizobium leguminosarum]|uniref:SIR2 family protein n=1 Tax=Rhizobium leguminosarum TaxID=384 RepID=UPI001C964581|nr:SIR2 family protein [Rhizobium leguminosarum]MBY5312305.1 hypothetical protein [Rhizobium leguminosarum]